MKRAYYIHCDKDTCACSKYGITTETSSMVFVPLAEAQPRGYKMHKDQLDKKCAFTTRASLGRSGRRVWAGFALQNTTKKLSKGFWGVRVWAGIGPCETADAHFLACLKI